ncbi:hypothetical protein GCM10009856_50470 [Mycolicibacterium llatzerense]
MWARYCPFLVTGPRGTIEGAGWGAGVNSSAGMAEPPCGTHVQIGGTPLHTGSSQGMQYHGAGRLGKATMTLSPANRPAQAYLRTSVAALTIAPLANEAS